MTIASQLWVPLAYAVHITAEAREEREELFLEVRQLVESGQKHGQRREPHHHDESHCPICQLVAALHGQGQISAPPADLTLGRSPLEVVFPAVIRVMEPALDVARARDPPISL